MAGSTIDNLAKQTGFDPNSLTPEQKQTWDMQRELSRIQANGTMMNMLIQHEQQQQKERFDLLSNTMKKSEQTKDNITANIK